MVVGGLCFFPEIIADYYPELKSNAWMGTIQPFLLQVCLPSPGIPVKLPVNPACYEEEETVKEGDQPHPFGGDYHPGPAVKLPFSFF